MTDDTIEEIKRKKAEALLESLTEQDATPASPDRPIEVESSDHLAEITARDGVVIVDCYADWCGPCQMLAPILDRIAAETAATIAKVDVGSKQAIGAELRVQGVPTLLVYEDGECTDRLVGLQPEDRLRSIAEGGA